MASTRDLTKRQRLTIRVAAAITGNDPWACGYTEYRGTYGSLLRRINQISRDHGGNPHIELYRNGQQLIDNGAPLEMDTLGRLTP